MWTTVALALAIAGEKQDLAMARGRAFAEFLLAAKPAPRPPFAGPRITYDAWSPLGMQYKAPTVADTLVGFRRVLRGCTIADVLHSDPLPQYPKSYESVGVVFNCPTDIAHAKGNLFLDLKVVDGQFVAARLQVGLGPAPPPPAPPR